MRGNLDANGQNGEVLERVAEVLAADDTLPPYPHGRLDWSSFTEAAAAAYAE